MASVFLHRHFDETHQVLLGQIWRMVKKSPMSDYNFIPYRRGQYKSSYLSQLASLYNQGGGGGGNAILVKKAKSVQCGQWL